LVVLAHGFVRTQSNMAGWADHLASWGVEVATPDLCHSSFSDADHAANAEEMIALAAALGGNEVIYAGQSAGGLSALIAAADDPNAIAAVGLDATDSSDLGVQRVTEASVPFYGLVGEPSTCNAESNGVAIYEAAPDATAVRVTEADHCDFEDVTDVLCTAICPGTNAQYSDEAIHDAILGLLTAAVLEGASGGDGLTRWWLPGGEDYEALTSTGAIAPL
jgi:dienelactone hydrolase